MIDIAYSQLENTRRGYRPASSGIGAAEVSVD